MVHFLSGRQGTVTEKPIQPEDIGTFSQVCTANISSASAVIIKCIYLRRFSEVHGARDTAYEVLSSLLHAREVPSRKVGPNEFEDLSKEEIDAAESEIRTRIDDFDYAAVLVDLKTSGFLKAQFEATDVGYEKVQLFRIMLELDPSGLQSDDVFTKFVNETYHIENEYVMQLNPREFDAVPEFVVKACTELVEKAAA